VIGVVPDAHYSNLHDPIFPVAYVPSRQLDEKGAINLAEGGTFFPRTTGISPISLVPTLRRLVEKSNPAYRVNNLQTQQELVDNQSIRERLLALLALFFATVALLLAAVGLYGVLNYSWSSANAKSASALPSAHASAASPASSPPKFSSPYSRAPPASPSAWPQSAMSKLSSSASKAPTHPCSSHRQSSF
jgi:hypothetical protein